MIMAIQSVANFLFQFDKADYKESWDLDYNISVSDTRRSNEM